MRFNWWIPIPAWISIMLYLKPHVDDMVVLISLIAETAPGVLGHPV